MSNGKIHGQTVAAKGDLHRYSVRPKLLRDRLQEGTQRILSDSMNALPIVVSDECT